MIEVDPRWPDVVFNTTCLIGPEGLLYQYRKVNPWIPYEVHASPHDIEGYPDPLFPVADTPIGRIGCAICYDWLFPEAMRQLTANGAEVLVRVSAYMDPWGATEPMNWWTIVNRCRALENTAFVVAANQGASLRHYPPYSWPGGSQIVDFDGRLLADASPGPGERIVVAPIDITALRHERATRRGHHMLAHLRTEAYPIYAAARYPPTPRTAGPCRGTVIRTQHRADRGGKTAGRCRGAEELMSGRLERMWVKRAHRGPMDPVDQTVLIEGQGMEDSANLGSHRQVTVIALERWLEMMAELEADVDPSARRADLMVSGVDLELSRGRLLKVGECVIRIGGEVRPCERMDQAFRGLRDVMTPRWGGGVWGDVLRGGPIAVGDPVSWHGELFEA